MSLRNLGDWKCESGGEEIDEWTVDGTPLEGVKNGGNWGMCRMRKRRNGELVRNALHT
jgi:hypothetical protein